MKNMNISKYNRLSNKLLTSIVFLFLLFFIYLCYYENNLNNMFNKINIQYQLNLNEEYDSSNNMTIKKVFNRLSILNAKISTPFSLHKDIKFNKWYDMRDHSQNKEYLKNIDDLFKESPNLKDFSELLNETEKRVMTYSDNTFLINNNKDFFRKAEELLRILINNHIENNNFEIALKRYEQYLTLNLIRNTYFITNPDFGIRAYPRDLLSIMFFNKEALNELNDEQIESLFQLTMKATGLKPSISAIVSEYRDEYNNQAKLEFKSNPLYFTFKEILTGELKSYNEIFTISLKFLSKETGEQEKDFDVFIKEIEKLNNRESYFIDYYSILKRIIKENIEDKYAPQEIKNLSFSIK